jgi:prepilin-type N-terminal cleavage/methylation domain-containing protein
MKRQTKNGAFTLVEIMIVVLIIGILMAIAVPNFIRARDTSRRNICIANLKQLDSAKEQWAMEHKATFGATILMSDIGGSFMKGPVTGPVCPGGGVYTLNTIGTPPECSLAAAPELHILQ